MVSYIDRLAARHHFCLCVRGDGILRHLVQWNLFFILGSVAILMRWDLHLAFTPCFVSCFLDDLLLSTAN